MKCNADMQHVRISESHPSRGAWIEIEAITRMDADALVAPLTGCVD